MNREETLIQYGKPILESEIFETAGRQTHHFYTTVASHSLNVAYFSILFIDFMQKHDMDVNADLLVNAALTHDLGILGRGDKYRNNYECLRRHPVDSVAVIREQFPDLDPGVCDAVSSHMFPLCTKVPQSKEAWLLSLADKCASCTDLIHHYGIPSEIRRQG